MPDVLSQLLRAPHGFNLFQAISLLERAAPARAPVGRGVGLDEAVRLGAHVDLAFAPSDIASVEINHDAGPAWTVRSAAMTLAGAQGPLAAPFTELLLEQRSERNRAGLEFLDIFNGRLLALWYRARASQHLALQLGATAPASGPHHTSMAPLLRMVDALSGLERGKGARGAGGEVPWLCHAGLQNAAPRSMTSLLTLLRDRFKLHFTGQQFVGAWHALAAHDQARLQGRAKAHAVRHASGMGRTLGRRAWDQAAGIALALPRLSSAQFAALLPGSPRFALLGWLAARHLQADFTVTLTLSLSAPPASTLGRSASMAPRLGRSAWLSSRGASAAKYRSARFVVTAPVAHVAGGG